MAKKPFLTLNLGTNGLMVTSEPPPMVGHASCLHGKDRLAVTHPSSSHARRCFIRLSCNNRRTRYTAPLAQLINILNLETQKISRVSDKPPHCEVNVQPELMDEGSVATFSSYDLQKSELRGSGKLFSTEPKMLNSNQRDRPSYDTRSMRGIRSRFHVPLLPLGNQSRVTHHLKVCPTEIITVLVRFGQQLQISKGSLPVEIHEETFMALISSHDPSEEVEASSELASPVKAGKGQELLTFRESTPPTPTVISRSRLDLSNCLCPPESLNLRLMIDTPVFAVPTVGSTGGYKPAKSEPSWELGVTYAVLELVTCIDRKKEKTVLGLHGSLECQSTGRLDQCGKVDTMMLFDQSRVINYCIGSLNIFCRSPAAIWFLPTLRLQQLSKEGK
ncbi:hypothetical protein J6590_055653 [Homalodisca vitripennis]|nr:hypothetical protein J6590_055653 [Homalodisca vitripennis]